jgi:hypothetical protein
MGEAKVVNLWEAARGRAGDHWLVVINGNMCRTEGRPVLEASLSLFGYHRVARTVGDGTDWDGCVRLEGLVVFGYRSTGRTDWDRNAMEDFVKIESS